MKSLKESLLDSMEVNINANKVLLKNPFKYLISHSFEELKKNKSLRKEVLDNFESAIAAKCKKLEDKSKRTSKFLIGIRDDDGAGMLGMRIVIKFKKAYILEPSFEDDKTWEMSSYDMRTPRGGVSQIEQCRNVYFLTPELTDQLNELYRELASYNYMHELWHYANGSPEYNEKKAQLEKRYKDYLESDN